MGEIYQAKSHCGYKSDTLLEGCGMAGPASCQSLAVCESCSCIVSVQSSNLKHRCPKCSRGVQIIKDESVPQRCFKCGKTNMKLHLIGMWD